MIPPNRVPIGYAEHLPPPDLAAQVVCVWTRLHPDVLDAPVGRVLPDGSADILFAFGRAGERGSDLTEAIVVGPMTKPMLVDSRQPRLYVGVRFVPGFAYAALGIPACEIVDERVDYQSLSCHSGGDLDTISGSTSDEQRVATVLDLVRRRLMGSSAVPRSVRAAVRQIIAAQGDFRVAALVGEIGITRQHLARQFAMHVGVTPKFLARVMRIQAALARADAARVAYPRMPNWSAMAVELGYYDQSHFIDDFKSLTGSTPGSWVP